MHLCHVYHASQQHQASYVMLIYGMWLQVAIEEVQQGLLERHSVLVERFRDLNTNIREDVRALARLWQLQVKMQSVGPGAYDQRLGRVVKARGLLEEQLRQRLVLLEGYSRISNMIEIEVEMNTSVRSPATVHVWNILLTAWKVWHDLLHLPAWLVCWFFCWVLQFPSVRVCIILLYISCDEKVTSLCIPQYDSAVRRKAAVRKLLKLVSFQST